MHVILRPRDLKEESLRYVKQLGVDRVCVRSGLADDYKRHGYLDYDTALWVRERLAKFDLIWSAFYLGKTETTATLLGIGDLGEELSRICRTLETLGRLDIPVVEYSLTAARVIREIHGRDAIPGYSYSTQGRGGAKLQTWDHSSVQLDDMPVGEIVQEQIWAGITQFLETCVPVAEQFGVNLACHPDDPPVSNIWGTAQVLRGVDGLKRFIDTVPSQHNGLLFCLGTLQESGLDVLQALRYFGEQGKIFQIDFRNVRKTVPAYQEVFLDEGDLDMWRVVKLLSDINYQWTMEPDHVPGVIGDTPWGHISRGWAIGYMKALIQAVSNQ